MTSIWTDDKVETLKSMWADGAPAKEIAYIIGVTRNSIIGKAHRLKLFTHEGMRRSTTTRKHAKRGDCGGGTVIHIRNRQEIVVRNPPGPWLGTDADIPIEQRKTIFELENHHCRWPVGTAGDPDFFYCGHPSADLAGRVPYCAVHSKQAWSKRN